MTLDFYLRPFVKTKIKSWVRQLLWMSLYQYIYLDKVPNHAIINEAVNIAKHRRGPHNGNVVNAILRTIFRSELPSLESIKNDKQRMAVEYSIPKWIIEHWITHYGVETTRKMASSFLIKLRVQYVLIQVKIKLKMSCQVYKVKDMKLKSMN